MKSIFAKLTALTLALALCLAAAALAEEAPALSDSLYDLQVKLGNKVYRCADTVEGLKEQGLSFEAEELKPGYYYTVNTGRAFFSVVVDALDRENAAPEDLWVCGYRLDAAETPNAEIIHGIVVGEATRASVVEAFGAPTHDYGSSINYQFHRYTIDADFSFDGEGEDAKLTEVSFYSSIPKNYGPEVSELAGVEQEGLPAPADLSFDQFILDGKLYQGKFRLQDLLDQGWRLSAEAQGDQLEAQGDSSYFISVNTYTLFNGKSMINAFVYNDAAGEGTCSPAEAAVVSVGVNVADDTSILLADGITNGSTLDEVTAVYGTNYETYDNSDGYTEYTFRYGDHVVTKFNIMDDKVVYIEIQTGI